MRLSTLIHSIAIAGAGLFATASAQPLEADTAPVTGTLDNGMSYIVLPHDNPAGRARVQIVVSSGSLNELESERGIAHYLEHMAFNGSENFKKNEVIAFFERMGLTFGKHQNAFTGLNVTAYDLTLPDAETETIADAFRFFADVATRISFLPDAIEDERGVILEERRTSLGPQQRIQEQLFARLFPGSLLGERFPIGTEERIKGFDREDFLGYYSRWYVPENMTMIVVADTDPAPVVAELEKAFGAKEGRPSAQRPVIDVPMPAQFESIIITDAELETANLSYIVTLPPAAPRTTEQAARDRMVIQLASAAFNRRMQAKSQDGEFEGLGVNAGMIPSIFDALGYYTVGAVGQPDQWQTLLGEATTEMRRAVLHGFTPVEIEDARQQILSGAQRFAEVEATLDADVFVNRYREAVLAGEPIRSAAQDLDLTERLLPGITAQDVSLRFADVFGAENLRLVLTSKVSDDLPSESELTALATEALRATPDAYVDPDRAESLLAEIPAPADYVEVTHHEPTDVWTAHLDNGALVHFKHMDEKKDSVWVNITLAGGKLLEDPGDHGLTDAAGVALGSPATSTLSSNNITNLMVGKNISVSGNAGLDSVTVSVSGDVDDLETGLQLAHLLITDAKIEPAAFDNWKKGQTQAIKQRKSQPMGVFQERMMQTIMPAGERRMSPLELEDLELLTIDAAQRRLDMLMAISPIEVAVVGDIDRDRAMNLIATYIGNLSDRERISDSLYESRRYLDLPTGPMVSETTVETQTPIAMVVAGSYGPDARNKRDVRLMSMAQKIISTRMLKKIREEKALVYSIGAFSNPSTAFRDMGIFAAGAPTDPAKADELASAIHEVFGEFAINGPTGEEADIARGQIHNEIDENLLQPGFWAGQLNGAVYRDRSLNDLADPKANYDPFTAEDIRDAFARYYQPDSQWTVVVTPEPAPATPAETAEPATN